MEKKKVHVYSGLAGVFGYFLGTLIYELLFRGQFGDHLILRALVVIITALLVGVLTYFYLKNKYPHLTKELSILEKDERGQLIRGKTSTYTLMFIALLAIILFTYAYLKDQKILSYMIALGYIATALFNIGVNSFLDKRN